MNEFMPPMTRMSLPFCTDVKNFKRSGISNPIVSFGTITLARSKLRSKSGKSICTVFADVKMRRLFSNALSLLLPLPLPLSFLPFLSFFFLALFFLSFFFFFFFLSELLPLLEEEEEDEDELELLDELLLLDRFFFFFFFLSFLSFLGEESAGSRCYY